MRQYAGFATPGDTNARFKALLRSGQTGLSLAFDLPTQLGLDPDSPLAKGEVGRVGVSIATVDDMDQVFDGIPLDEVTTSMTINAPAMVLLGCYLVAAERRQIAWERLGGTVQNDILKEYIARGTYIFPPAPSMRLVTDVIAFCAERLPSWNPISISGYHLAEAGATAEQEIGFTLANAREYVRATLARGVPVDAFAPRLSFFFVARTEVLREAAKFRAARRIYARMMREEFGAADERSWKLRMHVQTAGSELTAQQPDVNVVRVTLQALAAVLGGTQSLHTNARDEALALPTEASARLALRTQQVIAFEGGVRDEADPLGGSEYVERVTGEIEAGALRRLQRVEELGGSLRAVEAGYVQREIEESAAAWQREVEEGRRVVVGVNRFAEDGDAVEVQLQRIDPAEETRRAQEIRAHRQRRDAGPCERALARLGAAARSDENLFPLVLEALRAEATVGETCAALKAVWGEHRSS
jgi:methylmalonyl-CoA mutase N-terminal domain/subunit